MVVIGLVIWKVNSKVKKEAKSKLYLRNRSALAVKLLCNISLFGGQLLRRSNHERAVRVIYLRSTDRQTVNYYSTIHALELIYFDSNTQ